MNRVVFLFSVILIFAFLQLANAQVTPAVEVNEMVICTGVEDRTPIEADTTFLSTVGQLCCFTKVSSATESSTISHVWYYVDKEMARVDLQVNGENWRTWSSKRIVEDWKGDWRVDVLSETGEVLMSKGFKVQ